MKDSLKKYKNHFKYFIIYLISFCINYLIFILLSLPLNRTNIIGIHIVNLFSWVVSMFFIFYVDKIYVPDLVDENNSSELFKFILIRILSLIVEELILYIFISILNFNHYSVKLFSLIILFILNEFYIRNIQFK